MSKNPHADLREGHEVRIDQGAGVARSHPTAVGDPAVGLAKTGRFRRLVPREFDLARAWALSTGFETHEAYAEFAAAMLKAPLVPDLEIVCYRGRSLATGSPQRECFGPPKDAQARGNRYNAPGKAVLYLCDAAAAVAREVHQGQGERRWVQKFVIPTTRLRLADFAPEEGFLNHVFGETEDAIDPSTSVPPPGPTWAFSQFIASCVGRQFDGMRVRGVRGESGFAYCNIVIFDPALRWSSWLDSSSPIPIDR